MKLFASAGTADPSKEGFGREGQARFNTPLAHPAGWAGGLFTLRASRRGNMRLRGSETSRTGGEDASGKLGIPVRLDKQIWRLGNLGTWQLQELETWKLGYLGDLGT